MSGKKLDLCICVCRLSLTICSVSVLEPSVNAALVQDRLNHEAEELERRLSLLSHSTGTCVSQGTPKTTSKMLLWWTSIWKIYVKLQLSVEVIVCLNDGIRSFLFEKDVHFSILLKRVLIIEIIYFQRIYLSMNWMQCFQTLYYSLNLYQMQLVDF